jgi:hypothetical protein
MTETSEVDALYETSKKVNLEVEISVPFQGGIYIIFTNSKFQEIGDAITVIRGSPPFFVEYLSPGVNKGFIVRNFFL